VLPQERETWQGDFLNVGNEEHPLWLVWVTCPAWDLVLAYSDSESEPEPEWLWDTLVKAMGEPLAREPHRPTRVLVRHDGRWTALKPRLKELGITLAAAQELLPVDGVPELIDELYLEWAQKYKGDEDSP
jgi:hypothetical protein